MNLKAILPIESYAFNTNLSVAEALKRIADSIEPRQEFSFRPFFRTYKKPYTGHINGQSFTMNRNITYQNSFLPIINGQVSMSENQTQVIIKMQPAISVLIFISLWLIVVGSICIAILTGGFPEFKELPKFNFIPPILIPFILFTFGYLMTYFGFKAESKISKKFLFTL